jgi:diguanylate cyclase (GGDEF)-like protein
VAVLNVTDRQDRGSFTEADLEVAELLCRVAGMGLERHRFQERIELLQRESVTDALTGLGNRRHFEQRIASEMGRARRFGHPLSLIILDIDDFKFYNDTLGHPAGDAALRNVSAALLENVRSIDDVARYGGEEFAVVLPQTPIELSTVVGERIRGAMTRMDVEGSTQLPRGHFSVSVGVASYPRDARDDSELVNHADMALYMAKTEGKDRVVAFEPVKEDDRRTSRRIPIRLHTVIEGADEEGRFEEEGVIHNISAGGALMGHRRELHVETPLKLSIHSPFTNGGGNPIVFEADGRLVRTSRDRDGFQGAIAFSRELDRFA